MVGTLVYLACDEEAKTKLRAEETEKRLNLKGGSEDDDRDKMIDGIIVAIAHETSSERMREVNLVSEIHSCHFGANEATAVYANRFEVIVAKYIHQKNVGRDEYDQQWALVRPAYRRRGRRSVI